MSKCRCIECGNDSGKWIYRKSKREYKGENYCFELDVEIPYCEKCGSPIYDKEIEQNIREKANEIIRKQTGIISKEEIIEIVNSYEASQKFLSRVLGWGEITLPRYIKGSYSPNLENSNRLKSIKNPYVLLNLLENNIVDNGDSLRKKLFQNLNEKIVCLENEKGKIYKVVDWFLNNTSEEDGITHLALQKILYFVQAWSYTFNGEWIFNEECEAWVHGAVYRDVFEDFKTFKYSRLPQLKTETSLNEEEVNILQFVKNNYLDIYSAKTLEKICHLEEPFKKTRGDLRESDHSKDIISKDSIANYYKQIDEKYSINSNHNNVQNYLNDLLFNKIQQKASYE